MVTTIGERIRELRNGWLSQQELATAAGVSVELVRKLEQGQRHTASVANLQKIATALDVDITQLFAKPVRPPSSDPNSGVLAIRRVLTSVDDLVENVSDAVEPISLDEAERTVSYLWGARWAGRYELLPSLIPNALAQLRATYREANIGEKARAAHVLSRAYNLTGEALVIMGQRDASFLATREALATAKNSDDELLYLATHMSMADQMIGQGRYDDCINVALTAANRVRADNAASNAELSAYGLLTITAAMAAARKLDKGTVAELLAETQKVADRVGYEHKEHETTFGPTKVSMLAAGLFNALDELDSALRAARKIPRDAYLPPASRTAFMSSLALTYLRLGEDQKSIDALLSAEASAPDVVKYQTLPRQVTSELLTREKRKSTRLRELATRIGAARTS
ncbi:helix-turn-helix domain-containing protein [Amycolatopsis anabasis]|uniref:helix-turn-helix domain-containing protein n=1 Tax=Amycolatopsis anabasis TaxID=1840409 RepID=UPI00131AE980|nr:helix-turn-helix transcriptional regulator [Amycolatopsis anabasis]